MYRPGHYEDVKNITTGLMALRDIATLRDKNKTDAKT